jgi:hypothetical protein
VVFRPGPGTWWLRQAGKRITPEDSGGMKRLSNADNLYDGDHDGKLSALEKVCKVVRRMTTTAYY